jgi:hypothetical protein
MVSCWTKRKSLRGEMVDVPGGASGLLCRDFKGKEADRLVTRIAPGVVSPVAELRGHERQAGRGIGAVKYGGRGAQAPRRLAGGDYPGNSMTPAELEKLEKKTGDGEIARGGRPGRSSVASPQPAARHGEPARVFPANASPSDGRSRMDGVICGSRIRAVRGQFPTRRFHAQWRVP